jgi:hypothetical protein
VLGYECIETGAAHRHEQSHVAGSETVDGSELFLLDCANKPAYCRKHVLHVGIIARKEGNLQDPLSFVSDNRVVID